MPTVKELQKLAKERKIKNYSKMRKDELCKALNVPCDGPVKQNAKIGKKVKLNKPQCVGDRYEWIVGKGCFEKHRQRRLQKPRRQATSYWKRQIRHLSYTNLTMKG